MSLETIELAPAHIDRACSVFGHALASRWKPVTAGEAATWAREVYTLASSVVFARMNGSIMLAVLGGASLADVAPPDEERVRNACGVERILYVRGPAVSARHQHRRHATHLHWKLVDYTALFGYEAVVCEVFQPTPELMRYQHHWLRLEQLGWREMFASTRTSDHGPIHWLRLRLR